MDFSNIANSVSVETILFWADREAFYKCAARTKFWSWGLGILPQQANCVRVAPGHCLPLPKIRNSVPVASTISAEFASVGMTVAIVPLDIPIVIMGRAIGAIISAFQSASIFSSAKQEASNAYRLPKAEFCVPFFR